MRSAPCLPRRPSRLPLLLPLLLLVPLGGMLAACASSDSVDADRIKELQDRVLELQRKAAVADVELARLRQEVAELMARQGMPAPGAPAAGAAVAPAAPGAAPLRRSGTAGSGSVATPGGSRAAGTAGTRAAAPSRGGAPPARAASAPSAGRGSAIDETDIEVPVTSSSAVPPAASSGSDRRQAAASSAPHAAPYTGGPATKAPPASQAAPQAGPSTPPARAPQLPQAPPVTAPAAPAAPAGEARGEPVTPAVQALYDRGYTLYHQKHYVDAEASFQRFLQAEPNSELADNAQYWIGECRYSRGDMRGALAAFRESVARYPQGNKTADALLKAGMAEEALGDKEAARNTYQDVLRRFPGTAVAAVAEERRAKLP